MHNLINTSEIALFIMLPLIIFYKQSKWNLKSYIILIPILYLIWYLTYMLFHELTHWLGAWIFGKEVFEYKLIPRFWEGDFGSGYIKYDFKGDTKDFFIVILPYVRDIFFLIVGYLLLKKQIIKTSFLAGLVLLMLLLSSLYDISNNYLAYVFGSLNDFNSLKISSTSFISNFIGISFMLTAMFLTYKTIKISKEYPNYNF